MSVVVGAFGAELQEGSIPLISRTCKLFRCFFAREGAPMRRETRIAKAESEVARLAAAKRHKPSSQKLAAGAKIIMLQAAMPPYPRRDIVETR